jgi:hypothetical protein
MRRAVAVFLVGMLCGCGATYRVSRTGPDGVVLTAEAYTSEKSESIEFDFKGDLDTGRVNGLSFKKVGAEPVNMTADTLRALMSMAEKGVH